MDKFYVQSGTLRSIVQAESPRKAALWVVHRVMQQVIPIEDDRATTTDAHGEPSAPVAVLGGRLKVSPRGYDRVDAKDFETMDVISDWNEMVRTLDRLEKMLAR